MMRRALLTVAFLSLAAGCSNRPGPGPLAPDYHYEANPRGTDVARHVLIDKPEVMYDNVHVDPFNPTKVDVLQPEVVQQPSVTSISQTSSDLARQQLEHTPTVPATLPTTAPATGPAGPDHVVTQGTFIELGGVVVQVNEHPIFASQVLEPLRALLSAEAKRYDADGFRVIAAKEVQDQVMSMIRSELLLAQAELKLDQSEKDLAWQLTVYWQQQQIANAGGSLEQAKARVAADGGNFDDMLQDKFRQNKVGIYIEKKLKPRCQVTAQDVREYYNRHFKSDFDEPEQIQIRLIKIAIKDVGRDDALRKISDLKDRIAKGEDFQTLASEFNDDARLAKSGGLEQPIARGAYVNETVEQAVWKLQPGQVSDILQTPDAFYLAKVESRKAEHIRPFEDPAVQRQITEILQKEQFGPLMEQKQRELLEEHPIFPDPPRYELAVDLAMQMYPQWAAK